MAVKRIAAISLTTAMPDVLEAFYREAFGFEQIAGPERIPAAALKSLGVSEGVAEATMLRLGMQHLQLIHFEQSGSPYPPDVPGNDLRFQHFAIVAADMQKAFAGLQKCSGWTPITHSVPQVLPATSGSVSAFKFRDPEGHPLELLAFPQGAMPARWRQRVPAAAFAGIDHSAIGVADTARSIAFYRDRLGFAVSGGSCNRGIEQSRLDDLHDPVVEVTALSPAGGGPPHLEFLCYRSPGPRPAVPPVLASNDIAATRLVLEQDNKLSCGAAELIHDPDGHALLLVPAD